MKKLRFISLLLLLLAAACGEKLLELDPVLPVEFTTGALDTVDLTITGQILSVGDGLRQYGHLWSAETDNPTLDNTNSTSELGTLESPGEYTSNLVLSGSNVTYFIRGYVIDVHDCVHYGEIIEYFLDDAQPPTASYTASDNNCFASCTITYTSTSTNANQWKWYIDGVLVSENDSFSETFHQPGTYAVKLWVSNGELPDSVTKTTTILARTFISVLGLGEGKGVLPLANGDYLVAGTNRYSNNDRRVYVARLDSVGSTSLIFEEEYPLSDRSEAEDLIRLSNGKFAVVGYTQDVAANEQDFYYLMFNGDGSSAQGPQSLGTEGANERAHAVLEYPDGTVLIVGQSTDNNDVCMIRARNDLSSVSIPFKTVTGPENEIAYDVALAPGPTEDFFVVGTQERSGTANVRDVLLQRFDKWGTPVGTAQIIHASNYDDAFALESTPAGDLVFAGSRTDDIFAPADALIGLTDGSGAAPAYLFPPTGSSSELIRDVLVLPDGTIVVAGARDGQAYLLKISQEGVILAENDFGDAGPDYFSQVRETPDGGFVAVGSANGSLLLVKTDSQLETN